MFARLMSERQHHQECGGEAPGEKGKRWLKVTAQVPAHEQRQPGKGQKGRECVEDPVAWNGVPDESVILHAEHIRGRAKVGPGLPHEFGREDVEIAHGLEARQAGQCGMPKNGVRIESSRSY